MPARVWSGVAALCQWTKRVLTRCTANWVSRPFQPRGWRAVGSGFQAARISLAEDASGRGAGVGGGGRGGRPSEGQRSRARAFIKAAAEG